MLGLALLLLSAATRAQESPTLSASKFDYSRTFRTNVCDRQNQFFNGNVTLPNALSGLSLTVGVTNYSYGNERSFFTLENNRIPTDYAGYFAVIMDEVAQRANFTWRNSFGVWEPRNNVTDGNKSWTDILIWSISTYDISLEKWGQSVDRAQLGAGFPLGFWDSSAILGEVYHPGLERRVVNLWSFLDPFENAVWFAIIGAIVFTGFVYWLLESWNKDADERELDQKPLASVFYAAITFTGHYELRPQSHAARLVGFSFSFWALIVSSAYTANLASFLVSPRVAEFQVDSMETALANKARLCVQGGAILQTILEAKYPGIITVGKDSEIDVFKGIRDGSCDAVAHQFNSFEIYQHDILVNKQCDLASEKRVVERLPAGMATLIDNGPVNTDNFCTGLVNHVLDFHLTEMANDGFLSEAWQNHLTRISTITCVPTDTGGGTDEVQDESLSPADVGGIFIVHAALTLLALMVAVYQFYDSAKKEAITDHRTLKNVFGIEQVKAMSSRNIFKQTSEGDIAKETTDQNQSTEFRGDIDQTEPKGDKGSFLASSVGLPCVDQHNN